MTAPWSRTSVEGAAGGNLGRIENLEAVPVFASYEIKVTSDLNEVTTADTFIFCVPADLDGALLLDAQAFITTLGLYVGVVQVQLYNVTDAVNMLSTTIHIDAGEYTSYTSAIPAVIDGAADVVAKGDLIQIVVVNAGCDESCPMGLGVILKFSTSFPGA